MGKRIIPQRRGHGSSNYRSPSHRHKGEVRLPKVREGVGRVIDIIHDPGHTAPIAVVDFNGIKYHVVAVQGMYVNQEIAIGPSAPIAPGNILPAGLIPEGTEICCVEIKPGDGGKIARSAGSRAVVVSQGEKTTIRLPSDAFKTISPDCMAMIGSVAGSGRVEKPFAKAGNKVRAYRSKAKKPIKVRGIAMNAVNHPHGGGSHQHVGVPSTVPASAPPGRKVGRLSPKKKKR